MNLSATAARSSLLPAACAWALLNLSGLPAQERFQFHFFGAFPRTVAPPTRLRAAHALSFLLRNQIDQRFDALVDFVWFNGLLTSSLGIAMTLARSNFIKHIDDSSLSDCVDLTCAAVQFKICGSSLKMVPAFRHSASYR